MRLRRRSKFFLRFCSLFSILFSFFRHFFSLAYSRDINPRDIVRHQPRATSLHIYPWMGSCIFHPRDVVRHRPRVDISLNFLEISTQETSWDIDRRKISRHIYPGMGSWSFLRFLFFLEFFFLEQVSGNKYLKIVIKMNHSTFQCKFKKKARQVNFITLARTDRIVTCY